MISSKNSETEQQDVLMKIQASRSSSGPSLLWSVDKENSAGNCAQRREVWRLHRADSRFLPVSAPFKKSWSENDYYKIKIILAGSFSKNCCIYVKSQKTSVLRSLKQLKTLLTFVNCNLFYKLHSHDHQNNAVPPATEPWFGPCDWHIHYPRLSYCTFFIAKLVCWQNYVDRKILLHWLPV